MDALTSGFVHVLNHDDDTRKEACKMFGWARWCPKECVLFIMFMSFMGFVNASKESL